MRDDRPLIAHVVFRFDYGGLENGIVNLVNGLPGDEMRHAIIALTEASGFRDRIRNDDTTVHEIRKRPGKDPGAYVRLFRLFSQLRPSIVHTRNIGTIEGALAARLAGVPIRIHGEHGWDVYDPDGTRRKYRALRKAISPAINRFVTVSQELERWLTDFVGIRSSKVVRICNGVDTDRFRPAGAEVAAARALLPRDRFPQGSVVVGSITRFSAIKDPLNLVRAFLLARREPAGQSLRLVMAGDGELRAEAQRLVHEAGAGHEAWFAGSRDDVAELLRSFDIFVLGSRREGISNTVLESMASGLPAIACATGGNLELVVPGQTGMLVPPEDPAALSAALLAYAADPSLRRRHGEAARRRAEEHYSLRRMLADYRALYRAHLTPVGKAA